MPNNTSICLMLGFVSLKRKDELNHNQWKTSFLD